MKISRCWFLLGLFFVLFCSACNLRQDPRLGARRQLAELNIPFNKQSFVERVYEGDGIAVELFLKAGISPNSEGDISRLLVNPDPDFQRWMDAIAKNSRAWRRLASGEIGGGGLKSVYLPAYTVAKIKALGQSQMHEEVLQILAGYGASKDVAQAREERVKNEISAIESQLQRDGEPMDEDFFKGVQKEVEKRVGETR
jgi:hypothetical protein